MLDFTQPDDLSRQYLKRLRMVLKTLADIFHDQHIFTLVFIIIQQPLAQALRLFIIRMAGDGARQGFGAQQLATSPPEALGRGAEERVAGVEYHAEMIAVEIQGAAGGHQSDRINPLFTLQIGGPGKHDLFEIAARDSLRRLADKGQPFRFLRQMRFALNLDRQRTNGSGWTELLE